jgi:hypothetical protein
MNKIPTVDEFYLQKAKELHSDPEDMPQWMIEAANEYAILKAKLHVEAALKAVYDGGLDGITSWDGNPYTGEGSDYLDQDKLLNAYPLTNIV